MLDTDVFPPSKFATVGFIEGIVLYAEKTPISTIVEYKLKPHPSPVQVSLYQDLLFSILPGTPKLAAHLPLK